MLCLIVIQGSHDFINWFTGSFLLYVAAFFFLWPTAHAITGRSIIAIDSIIPIFIGIIAWLVYAGVHDWRPVDLAVSILTIVFIISLLYTPFAWLEKKLTLAGDKK